MQDKICRTCAWWCGNEMDDREFCDEKEISTSAENYCPKWLKRPAPPPEIITDVQKDELSKLIQSKTSITDSDIYDFCCDFNISPRAVFHQLAELNVPERCRDCKHVDLYPSMPPCSSCCRAHPDDNYTPAES